MRILGRWLLGAVLGGWWLGAQAETVQLAFQSMTSLAVIRGEEIDLWPEIHGLPEGNHSINGKACTTGNVCSDATMNFDVNAVHEVVEGARLCFGEEIARCFDVK